MGADTPRRIGYFTAASFLIFLLTVSIIVPVNFTFSSQTTAEEEQFPQSIIASSSTETTPHFLNLKATQQGDAEPERVSGFNIDTTNTVVAQINSAIHIFVTDSFLDVIEAKVRTVSGQLFDLIPSTASQAAYAFSLTNLPAGVYTLDVITEKGNTKAAYEGILVISQQPTIVINETTRDAIDQEINQNVRVETNIIFIFRPSPPPPVTPPPVTPPPVTPPPVTPPPVTPPPVTPPPITPEPSRFPELPTPPSGGLFDGQPSPNAAGETTLPRPPILPIPPILPMAPILPPGTPVEQLPFEEQPPVEEQPPSEDEEPTEDEEGGGGDEEEGEGGDEEGGAE